MIGRDIDDGAVFELVDLRERERNVTDLGLTLIRPLPKPHSTNSSTIHFSHIAWNQVGQAYDAEMLALGLSSRIRLDCEVLKSTI